MDAKGILSLDTKFYISTDFTEATPNWTQIYDLQEVPELGGSAENVEITTLQNAAKRYIKGIKDYGELSFVFLYDNSSATSNYRVLRGHEDTNTHLGVKVELPDETSFIFEGQVSTVLNSIGVNAALTFNANFSLSSDITVVNPTGE